VCETRQKLVGATMVNASHDGGTANGGKGEESEAKW